MRHNIRAACEPMVTITQAEYDKLLGFKGLFDTISGRQDFKDVMEDVKNLYAFWGIKVPYVQ